MQQQAPSHKLFILVDSTLSRSQQAVQACHAAIEFAKAYPDWKHQSLVLLGVRGEEELQEWFDFLSDKRDLKTHHFRESFWDDRLTAVACHGCDEFVANLPLL